MPDTPHAASRTRLAFFLSLGGSLGKWQREGIIDREMLLPLTYLRQGIFEGIDLLTYSAADGDLLTRLRRTEPLYDRVRLLAPPAWFGDSKPAKLLWSLVGPFLHREALASALVLKTNQVSGAWAAMLAGLVVHRPLVLRMGYVLSRRYRLNGNMPAAAIATAIEWLAARQAAGIVVTSEEARGLMAATAGDSSKVHLVPTYVDTSLFRQKTRYDFDAPILYVGRLTPQKNLVALITACGALGHELHLIGIGPQQAELENAARAAGAKVRFLGRVPNERLAEMMQAYTVFALPSLHEGLPKVLIEAMASGMLAVGTDIPGINDLVVDGETGYLAETTSADAIEQALRRCLAERNEAIGAAARRAIEERLSIDSYARAEGALLLTAARPSLETSDAKNTSPGRLRAE